MHPTVYKALQDTNFEFDDSVDDLDLDEIDGDGMERDSKSKYWFNEITRAIIKFLAKMEGPHFNSLLNGW